LINDKGDIVKRYRGSIDPEHLERDLQNIPQTDAERLAKALPFPGVIDAQRFRRNYLSYGAVFFQREYFDQAKASFRLALRCCRNCSSSIPILPRPRKHSSNCPDKGQAYRAAGRRARCPF
jgi:hypothetical protein